MVAFTFTSMPITQRNRMFSSIANTDKNHAGFQYFWSDTAIITGVGGPITGAWVPGSVSPDGALNVNISGVSFSGELNVENNVSITGQTIPINVTGVVNSGNYGFFNTAITGSQSGVPAGAWSWSVYIESGVGFVNGVLYNTFESIQGGGYDGMKRLSSAINVGCTGSAATPARVLISYEL